MQNDALDSVISELPDLTLGNTPFRRSLRSLQRPRDLRIAPRQIRWILRWLNIPHEIVQPNICCLSISHAQHDSIIIPQLHLREDHAVGMAKPGGPPSFF